MREKRKKFIWNQIKGLKWGSVYLKYLGQLLILLAVPFAIFIIFMFSMFESRLESEIKNANTVSLLRISNTIDMSVQNIYNQLNWLSGDNNVMYFLSETAEAPFDYEPQNIVSLLKGIVSTSSFVDSVHIYSIAGNNVISLNGGGDINNFYDSSWYEEYTRNREKPIWFQAREIAGKKKVITVFYFIKYIGEHKGAIILNLSVDSLVDFMATNSENIYSTAIYDNDGFMLFPENSGEKIEIAGLSEPVSVMGNDKKIKSVITYIKSDKTGWTYTSALKLTQYSKQAANLSNFTYITVWCGVLICIALALYVFSLMVRPVNKIMSAIGEENLRGNEIDFIVNAISKTKIDKQKQDAELENRLELLKKAQITAMQAQISPHFLLNILTTIRFMAMKLTSGENDVTAAVTSLVGLYRVSLSDSEHFTTVRAEIEHVTRYIELQKIRFKDKFEVEFSVAPEIMNMSAVKIMLQPIVENAIAHGIRPMKDKGIIKIKAHISGKNLIFVISDNGVGMSGDKLDMLNLYMKSDYFEDFQHIGVKNVNQRLKLIFGNEYGVSLWSKQGVGTKVTIVMPAFEA